MSENRDRTNQLLARLDTLMRRQDGFAKEIVALRDEINSLKTLSPQESPDKTEIKVIPPPAAIQTKDENINPSLPSQPAKAISTAQQQPLIKTLPPKSTKSGIEKFIGENLINKIGIAITIIGVAIGAKYSIEHQLISPLTRIILGYAMGLGLLGFGIKLKKNYENYSAVLVSGAIAILYVITYSAYSFYGLIPRPAAFILMVIFTAFAVVAAIQYNRQVIAHIGLVGAYAVPFLLSDGSGNVAILFSYMAIINIGILCVAVKKYWKSLYYSSFLLTWLIYFVWYITKYEPAAHFALSLIFLSVFFATFYLIFLLYKLFRKEKFEIGDIVLLLANSFIFFGISYSILSSHKTGAQLLGLFALCNAILHFAVSVVIYRQKLADRNLFYLVSGLVLVFITIAIPVQLDGNWVTLLWVCEAALLFWIGRTKNVPVYETLSYPLMLLSFLSILQDWQVVSANSGIPQNAARFTPIFNITFLTSLLFIAAFAFINYLNANKKYVSSLFYKNQFGPVIHFALPAILLIVIYYACSMQISGYCDKLYAGSALEIKKGDTVLQYWNEDLARYKIVWLINYSLFFLSILSMLNIKKIKNISLAEINLVLNALAILLFLGYGLFALAALRDNYLGQLLQQYYHRTAFNIGIRYISYAFVIAALISTYNYFTSDFLKAIAGRFKIAFDFMLHITVLWIASSELITWMDIFSLSESYKLGLSILWGVYALFLIGLGIWKNKKHLRIGAILLFGVTLIKLFFYDIAYLGTIAKTIVFVSLGVLLLIISFLYNKYKHLITDEVES